MRIFPFTPNNLKISQRKEIQPFITNKFPVLKENICFNTNCGVEAKDEAQGELFMADDPFIHNVSVSKTFKKRICVRITNLPLSVDEATFFDITSKHCCGIPFTTFITKNKETKVFEGVGYIVVDNEEDGMEVARRMRKVVVSSLRLNAEFLNNK